MPSDRAATLIYSLGQAQSEVYRCGHHECAKICAEAAAMLVQTRTAIRLLRTELCDTIDGGDECRGRDTQISRWIALCNLALGNPIDPWAYLALQPDLKDHK